MPALTTFQASVKPLSFRDRAFQALNDLPPFNPALNKLLATLAKEDVFFSEVAAVIEKDTVLASNVLKLVNSALYARAGTVNSVRSAVAILGLTKLRNLALSLSVSRMFKQVRTPKWWRHAEFNLHSVATAIMADTLAQRLAVSYPEGAFTAGLLHGIGKLLMAVALPDELDRVLEAFQTQETATMEEVELACLGCSHVELASAALAQWRLPVEIQQAVATQHQGLAVNPQPGSKIPLGALLHEAHELVNQVGISTPTCASPLKTAPAERLAGLGLQHAADQLLAEYQSEFEAICCLF
ncbi:MAG: HDOD domain-containing protein [Bryobacteraceae bacterium]|nr:HDOD domain-containing protein [Bryobacteraceae bacterium]MDW8377876.1 HDOD domain-containing protein [Bryobacterales bacterium]